jgi:GntR family transcriptional regulator
VSLNPESPVPLYIQLKKHLQTQIEAGVYSIGARLPSERELARDYNLSRMTARQALQLLSQDGLTQSRVGKGTYVRQHKIDQELRALTGFTEDMQRRGLHPSSRILTAELQQANEEAATRLHILPGAEVVVLSRVRLADDEPLAIETATLGHHLCPNLLERYDFSQDSLYRVLRQHCGIQLIWADQVIEARLPHVSECQVLHINAHEPVLSTVRVTFTDQDQPIEFVRSVYRGSHYQFRAILRQSTQ